MSNDQEFRMPSDIHDPFTDDDGAAGEEDPLAPTGTWTASKWDGAGGSAMDDQGNTVIMTKEGAISTITPSGSSATTANGRVFGGRPSAADGASSGSDDLSVDE